MDVWAYILDDGVTVAATMDINSVPQGVETTKFTVQNLSKTNFKVQNGEIVIDEDLAVVKARANKIPQLAISCGQAITAGFNSGNCRYGSQTTDQLNIHTAAKYGGSLWTLDSSNNWNFVDYTPEQAQQIEQDLSSSVMALQTKYANLVSQVKASSNIEFIESIVWS
jgi:hypothetical protein